MGLESELGAYLIPAEHISIPNIWYGPPNHSMSKFWVQNKKVALGITRGNHKTKQNKNRKDNS